jgi:predicted nucleic acid-binding protein
MGDPLFMDTSFALAGLDVGDQWHPAAMRLKDSVSAASRVVTTSAVVTEICDAMSAPRWRTDVHRFVESILKNPKAIVVHVGPDLLRSAFDLFADRPDKHWSLTDCISFVVMDQMKVRACLTADRHFEQAGFVALMRS